MQKVLFTILILLVPGLSQADDHTRIAAIYKCTLNEGATMDQVMEVNKRWLVNVRKLAGTDEINSYAMEPKVGDFNHFMFIDSYPDTVTWARIQDADETEETKAIEEALDAAADCEKNRLYESTRTMP
jgi:hypothetical protein